MLSVISGKQRAGKSCYAVKEVVIDFLKNSERPIFTNLPLNPDFLCSYIARDNSKKFSYMERLYLFMDCSFLSLRFFERKNPLYYVRCSRSNIITDNNLRNFWDFIKPNSVVVFDETYEFLGSLDSFDKSADNIATRKKLLSFTRQHGHLKTDLFLISHDYKDLDTFIKRGIQYLYMVKNSKYTNIFQNRFMRGLKWPMQFFIVEGYGFGETVPSDRWMVRPDRNIFKCYNSFSHIAKLGFVRAGEADKSTDIDSNARNFKRFFRQFYIWIIVGFACLIGLYYGVLTVKKMLHLSSKNVNLKVQDSTADKPVSKPDSLEISKTDGAGDKSNDGAGDKLKPLIEHKIIMRSSDSLLYEDGLKIKKGGYFNGFKIESIEADIVVLSARGRIFRCAISGLRK